jgi:hypothetical protein
MAIEMAMTSKYKATINELWLLEPNIVLLKIIGHLASF